MYVDDGIDVYPDSQNHPIAFFLQKFYIFNFLLDSVKYLENGISIRKIIKKTRMTILDRSGYDFRKVFDSFRVAWRGTGKRAEGRNVSCIVSWLWGAARPKAVCEK